MTAPRALPMPDLLERDFQAQVVELAGICQWTVLHVRRSIGRRGGKSAYQTTTSLKGWPDLLAWKPGRIIAAELKRDKGRLTDEQTDVLRSLAAAGVEVFVWRPADWDQVVAVLGDRGFVSKDQRIAALEAQVTHLAGVIQQRDRDMDLLRLCARDRTVADQFVEMAHDIDGAA